MSKIKIQEISTQNCVSCAAAKKLLQEEIQPQFPDVEIEYIDMLSEQGMNSSME